MLHTAGCFRLLDAVTLLELLLGSAMIMCCLIAARRCGNAANQRLGIYDPIQARWQVPPSEVEQHDEQMRLRAHGLVPTKRKVPTSPNVGVYDPVR